jgi:hypothetical protein
MKVVSRAILYGGDEQRAGSMTKAIAVVADDIWWRTGVSHFLNSTNEFNVFDAQPQDCGSAQIAQSDVVLFSVECVDTSQWDHFAALTCFEALRETNPSVIAVSTRPLGQLARLRLLEAGVTAVALRKTLNSLDDLRHAIENPDSPKYQLSVDPLALKRVGLRPSSRINAGLKYLQDAGYADLFERGSSTESTGLSRRALITLRSIVSDIIDLRATDDAASPIVQRTVPAWRDIVDVVNRSRHV